MTQDPWALPTAIFLNRFAVPRSLHKRLDNAQKVNLPVEKARYAGNASGAFARTEREARTVFAVYAQESAKQAVRARAPALPVRTGSFQMHDFLGKAKRLRKQK